MDNVRWVMLCLQTADQGIPGRQVDSGRQVDNVRQTGGRCQMGHVVFKDC